MAAIEPDITRDRMPAPRRSLRDWLVGWVASPRFQSWASGFPLTRGLARRDGARLFDLVAGFAYSQTLLASVETGLLEALQGGAMPADALARHLDLEPGRTDILCRAAAALGLIRRDRKGRYHLARLGAATLGVPGLTQMIRHHAIFYRDLSDPVALLRGQSAPELARFWPYVTGQSAQDVPQDVAATYSDLMARSQVMVAEETLRLITLPKSGDLLDIGGGTGAFLKAVRAVRPELSLSLLDLPTVLDPVRDELASFAITACPGSFRAAIPGRFDAVTLVRVLYDHSDDTVRDLLSRAHDALRPGGQIIVSEPMTGGDSPSKSGDVYFALYTLAMTTGKARAPERIAELLSEAGFVKPRIVNGNRPFVTSLVSAERA